MLYLYKYALRKGVMILGGKTSTESKSKYNAKSYATHLYSYRKNSEFGERVRGFKAQKGTSLNYLITKFLAEHWEVDAPMCKGGSPLTPTPTRRGRTAGQFGRNFPDCGALIHHKWCGALCRGLFAPVGSNSILTVNPLTDCILHRLRIG